METRARASARASAQEDDARGGVADRLMGRARAATNEFPLDLEEGLDRLMEEESQGSQDSQETKTPGSTPDSQRGRAAATERDSPSRRRLAFQDPLPDEQYPFWGLPRPDGGARAKDRPSTAPPYWGEDDVFLPRVDPRGERRPSTEPLRRALGAADRLLKELASSRGRHGVEAPGVELPAPLQADPEAIELLEGLPAQGAVGGVAPGSGEPEGGEGPPGPVEVLLAKLIAQIAGLQLAPVDRLAAERFEAQHLEAKKEWELAMAQQREAHKAELRRVTDHFRQDLQGIAEEGQKWKAIALRMPVPEQVTCGVTEGATAPAKLSDGASAVGVKEEPMDEGSPPASARRSRKRRSRDHSSDSSSQEVEEVWVEEEEEPLTPFLVPLNDRTRSRGARPFFMPTSTAMRPRGDVKFQTYDGTLMRLEDWLHRFETMAATRRFTQSDLATHLLNHLRGEPLALCKRIKTIGRPYVNVRNEVFSQITGTRSRPSHKATWHDMRRGPKESHTMYLERLKDQAALAFRPLQEGDDLFFELVRERFLESCWEDPSAGGLVELQGPATWEALREKAATMESIVRRRTQATGGADTAVAAAAQASLRGFANSGPPRGHVGSPAPAPPKTNTPRKQNRRDGKGQSQRGSQERPSQGTPAKNHQGSAQGESTKSPRKRFCGVCHKNTHWTDQCWSLSEMHKLYLEAQASKEAPKPKEKEN